MAKKKITISEEQLLITDEGEIIKAKQLLRTSCNLLQWDGSYTSASILDISESEEDLIVIGGAQGRTITCSSTTKFLGYNNSIFTTNKTLIGSENSAIVSRYLPIYGDVNLSTKQLDYLKGSLSHLQGKRPNAHLEQTLPLSLSKLNKKSLKIIVEYLFKNKRVQHLDQDSKDILIILLSRLGLYFNGQTKHVASNITGSIELTQSKSNISTKPTKKESIRFISDYKGRALDLTFNKNDCILIGSFLCPIS
tara:strand:+ start:35 stop:787 length:753 start_codon:yes stop_codon:yes gene_type:complete